MRINIYILLIVILAISSCKETIEMNLNDENNNRLVVEGSISTEEKSHIVKLRRTSNYFYNQAAKKELGAIVSITDGSNTFVLSDDDNDGIYHTEENVKGVAGNTYRLDIELTDGGKYFAESYLQKVMQIDSLQYEYKKSDMPFSEEYYYSINLYAQEPAVTDDCYQWELYMNGIHISDTLRNKTFITDEFINGIYFKKWPIYEIPEELIISDITEVKIQMLSISKADYDFKYALMLETDYASAGFKGPPANIPSNISNGGIGFFSASDIVEETIEIYFEKNIY